ncbi:hypothetical protein PISL3812_03300 [Talaromyces islandicus]|uniref:PXMP2/4 family protein 3 n=1 Tax=Talaromyces islandicus TaxID=28573 RepID=A0A0U1LSQ8_TALIS|nr:hypothetical protein PISL3812_03300 [Talaromyces islandicus]
MAPPIVTATLQAAAINAASNIVAQAITAYRSQTPLQLDYTALAQFTAVALINTPPTYLWMVNLESTFPGQSAVTQDPHAKKSDDEKRKNGQVEKKLNVRNTVIKVIIDQTIGASIMLVLFLSTITILRGGTVEDIGNTVQNEYWTIMLAGLKVWPPVSLFSFTVVPVDKRMLFGSICGFIWAIYLSMATA